MNVQRGFSSLAVVLVVVGVLVVGVGGYLVVQQFGGEPVVAPTSDVGASGVPQAEVSVGGSEDGTYERLVITDPQEGARVGRVFVISGAAWGWFEGHVPFRVYDGNDVLLYDGFFTVPAAYSTPRPFSKGLTLTNKPTVDSGRIEFTDYSQKDGSLQYQKLVPLLFDSSIVVTPTSGATRKVQLYYYNLTKDKEIADYVPCSLDAVLPVAREIPVTITPIQDVVRLLLEGGLTDVEEGQGFQTEFPLEGVSLVGANLQEGALTLELSDPNFRTSGGSCRAGLLRAQVEKTALQFDNVVEVRFIPESLFQS